MKLEFKDLKELLTFNIKYYRYLNNISQEKLAELCGLSPKYITDIERGKHCPTINKIEILANNLGIEAFALFQNPPRKEEILIKMKNKRQYNQKL